LAEPLARQVAPVDEIELPIVDSGSRPDTGARLALAVLAYVALMTAVVTLLPFDFAMPRAPRVMLFGGWVDVVANIGLFVPLGFLYAVARQDAGVSPVRIMIVGLAASAAIESLQMFEVTRYASLSDVAANAAGAYLGAAGQRRLSRRIAMDARTLGRLSLELPLMGLVYLLVPLLWLDGLAGVDSAMPLWPLLALGLFGASLLAAAQRHHFGPNRLLTRELMAGAACAWFLLGAFPGLAPRAAIVMFVMLAAVGAFVWVRSVDRSGAKSINRRFESRALGEAAPFYAAYLLLLVAPPSGFGSGSWRGALGFAALQSEWSATIVLHLLETVGAFTLLGYMVAEFRGRRESSFRQSVVHVGAWSAVVAVVAQLLEGFRVNGGASGASWAMLVASSVYGAWLYHLQRAHVRRLLGRG
jgi:glycopeptide antibiotics resistance protein